MRIVDNVSSQSSFVNISVGPRLSIVGVNDPTKTPIVSNGVVDSTSGALTLGNQVASSNKEAFGLNLLQSSLANTLSSNIDRSFLFSFQPN